jgi:surface polysaccharide O-acyltransferase-like enzyme
MKTRLYFLDNLRTFMIFLVVVLHAGLVYVEGSDAFWVVTDPSKVSSLGLVNTYLDLFVMCTVFYISGYFIPRSVQNKAAGAFTLSKFRRILVPWGVAVLTLIPAYKFLYLEARGLPQEAWYTYFHFFERSGSNLALFSNKPTQNWLWFLPILFVFQMAYLGLSRITGSWNRIPIWVAVTITILVGAGYGLYMSHIDLSGWTHSILFDFQRERLLVYFLVFLLGAISYEKQVFVSGKNHKKLFVAANIVLTVSLFLFTMVSLNFFFNMLDPGRNHYYISLLADAIGYFLTFMLSMLSILFVLIHSFRNYLNKPNALLDHLSKNSYAVYIIHMAVLGVVALILVSVPMAAMLKYVVLITATFVLSNGLVHAYRRFVKPRVSLRIAGTMIFTGMLFTLIHVGGQEGLANGHFDEAVSQAEIDPPQMDLHEAVIKGDLETVKQHVQAGTDLDIADPVGGSSPLITASLFGKTEIALLLMESGADVNFVNKEGSTAMHTAAFFCRTEIVKALLENGADKTIRNNAGSTALESVQVPFEVVKGYYDYFGQAYASMGLVLDYELIQKERPVIAEMLSD